MKTLLFALLMSVTAPIMAASYPDADRFSEYNVKGTSAYIIVDNKTGCQYLTGNGAGSSYTLVEGTCTNLPVGAHK